MRVFLIGYPGDIGGACTEAWHTIKLWRRFGVDVQLVPTWSPDDKYRRLTDELECTTHTATAKTLDTVPDLAGSTCVSFCNGEFLAVAGRLRDLGCRLVWVNCMTFLFPLERRFCDVHGPFDRYVFQSKYQRDELEPQLDRYGYTPDRGHLIRGAFDFDQWQFAPRSHATGEPFVVGRAARPDLDKWSSNTWPIYGRIQYRQRQALMLGMTARTQKKCGTIPPWAEVLSPRAIETREFFARLHCTLPVNGGARENWPRVGLEAMAAGVPIVAQNQWGWRDMIEHGVTGFLGGCDEELAHYAAMLAYDEDLRMRIVHAARNRLVDELANPDMLWAGWKRVFESISAEGRTAA